MLPHTTYDLAEATELVQDLLELSEEELYVIWRLCMAEIFKPNTTQPPISPTN